MYLQLEQVGRAAEKSGGTGKKMSRHEARDTSSE